jgi:hypothetical protein
MPRRKEAYLSVLSLLIILDAIMITTLADFAKFGIAQGQANDTSSSSLTPEQKDEICNPDNPASRLNPVNTTESKICGIPKTLNSTSSAIPDNTTTGAEEPQDTTTGGEVPPPPDNSIAPSAVP